MRNTYFKKAGFTLAEVLITLLIIGIVAAMTLPTLFRNIADRQNATKVAVFNSKFIQSLNSAKAAGDIGTQFKDTYDFLQNGLSKHLKMTTICKKDNLENCLGYDKITYDKKGKDATVDVSSLTTASKLNIKAAGFEDTAAFVMGDGTPVILSYNTKCNPDGGVDKSISMCVAGLYDINGSRKPNMFVNKIATGKNDKEIKTEIGDLRSFNGASVGSGCVGEIGNLCIASGAAGGSESAYDDMYNAIKKLKPSYTRPMYDGGYDYWQISQDYCSFVVEGNMLDYNESLDITTAIYGEKDPTGSYDLDWTKNKDTVFAALGINDTATNCISIWLADGGLTAICDTSNEVPHGKEYYYSLRNTQSDAQVVCVTH